MPPKQMDNDVLSYNDNRSIPVVSVSERFPLLQPKSSAKNHDASIVSSTTAATRKQKYKTATTGILAFSLLVQSYLLVSVFPYSGFLAMHLIPKLTEETAGSYAGFIASSFMFGRMFSSFEWGKLADKYGRVFVIKSSFLLSAMFSICFGFASSFPMVLFLRCVLGISNGLIGPIKTMVSEYCQGDRKQETHMMAIVMGMWGYGFLINPALSGYLSDPIKQYPSLQFGATFTTLLTDYPFLLPNILGSILCVIGYFLVDKYVEETLPDDKIQPFYIQDLLPSGCCSGCSFETNHTKNNNTIIRNVSSWGLFKHLHNDGGGNDSSEHMSVMLSPSIYKEKEERQQRRRSLNDFIVRNDKYYDEEDEDVIKGNIIEDEENDNNKGRKQKKNNDKATISSLLKRQGTRQFLVLYCFFSFLVTIVDEVFPLYCMSKSSGLGIEEKLIGNVMSATGVCYIMCQYFFVTGLSNRFGIFNALRIGMMCSIPLVFLIPVSLLTNNTTNNNYHQTTVTATTTIITDGDINTMINDKDSLSSSSLSWSTLIYISIIYAVIRTFSSVVFSTISITLNQSVPAHQRATMNGLSMLGGSIGKGCGPIFGGMLFSFCANHITPPYGSVVVYGIISILGLCQGSRVVFFWKDVVVNGNDDTDTNINTYNNNKDKSEQNDNKNTRTTSSKQQQQQQKLETSKSTKEDAPISF